MPAEAPSSLYEQLAEKYHTKGRFPERDRFLILAADAAWNAGQPEEAERFRRRILEVNPNHLLRPYPSFADSLKSADILAYVQQLRRGYPRERALDLMKELDQEPRSQPRTEEDPGAAARSPGVFKMAADPPARLDFGKATSREAAPPRLSQSHTLPTDVGRPKPPPTGPSWQPSKPAASVEPAAGAIIGTFLFLVVSIAAVATLAYVFVWPFLG